jgi:hypothetical protein
MVRSIILFLICFYFTRTHSADRIKILRRFIIRIVIVLIRVVSAVHCNFPCRIEITGRAMYDPACMPSPDNTFSQ